MWANRKGNEAKKIKRPSKSGIKFGRHGGGGGPPKDGASIAGGTPIGKRKVVQTGGKKNKGGTTKKRGGVSERVKFGPTRKVGRGNKLPGGGSAEGKKRGVTNPDRRIGIGEGGSCGKRKKSGEVTTL